MSNPINNVRMQRPLAAVFVVLVLFGLLAGTIRTFHAAATPPPTAVRHHVKAQPQEARR